MRFIKGSQVNTGKATHIEFKSDYYETQWKIVLRFLCKCRLRVQCLHPGPCDWDNNHVRYMIRYTQTSLSPATSFSSSKGNQGSPLSMSWVCPGASYWWLMPWTPHLRGAQEASWSDAWTTSTGFSHTPHPISTAEATHNLEEARIHGFHYFSSYAELLITG